MEIKVVCGSNYGDEGKGLTSYCLAKDAIERGNRVLTVLYNGGAQRGHTANGKVYHCTGTGNAVGGDTYYHYKFLVDPITLWLTNERVIIDPNCRVILPCDVMRNRAKETERGNSRHGSCGMGIFEASKRSSNEEDVILACDFEDSWELYKKARKVIEKYPYQEDELYNLDNWMRAIDYIKVNCSIKHFNDIAADYDTIIFEGGQGLLLDQSLIKYTQHLTPSSVGGYNISGLINSFNCKTDIYYVSRSYITRHGRGPMETECGKSDINEDIIDKTNQPNDWQESLRFGYLNQDTLANRIKKDFSFYTNADAHLVFTQLNYTNGEIAIDKNKTEGIIKPEFITNVYGSFKEDYMEKLDV